jgi:hypothetical protein
MSFPHNVVVKQHCPSTSSGGVAKQEIDVSLSRPCPIILSSVDVFMLAGYDRVESHLCCIHAVEAAILFGGVRALDHHWVAVVKCLCNNSTTRRKKPHLRNHADQN